MAELTIDFKGRPESVALAKRIVTQALTASGFTVPKPPRHLHAVPTPEPAEPVYGSDGGLFDLPERNAQ